MPISDGMVPMRPLFSNLICSSHTANTSSRHVMQGTKALAASPTRQARCCQHGIFRVLLETRDPGLGTWDVCAGAQRPLLLLLSRLAARPALSPQTPQPPVAAGSWRVAICPLECLRRLELPLGVAAVRCRGLGVCTQPCATCVGVQQQAGGLLPPHLCQHLHAAQVWRQGAGQLWKRQSRDRFHTCARLL